MTVDYQEPNKVTPSMHATGPLILDIMDQLTYILSQYYYVIDLAIFFLFFILK